jgi:hypothetical protein
MRLLVGVTTCHRYEYLDKGNKEHPNGVNTKRVQAIRETWAKKNAGLDIRYFYGRGGCRLEGPNEVFLNVPDDYYHLPEKMQGVFRWALDRGYDGLLKCDDDVFVNLAAFLQSDYQDHDYIGHVIDNGGYRYICGFAYFVSKKSMEIYAAEKLDLLDGGNFDHSNERYAEDKWVGITLGRNGIKSHNDPKYQECVCDVCWKGYKDQIAVHTTPRNELMYELYPNV